MLPVSRPAVPGSFPTMRSFPSHLETPSSRRNIASAGVLLPVRTASRPRLPEDRSRGQAVAVPQAGTRHVRTQRRQMHMAAALTLARSLNSGETEHDWLGVPV